MRTSSSHAILTLCVALVAAVPVLAQEAPAAPDAPAAPAAPKVVIDEPVYEHGQVSQGEEVRHDFIIRNEGNADLEIVEVRPTCGCTVADYDKTIPPGGSGKVHVVVDTTGFDGGIAKGLTVLTNDPQMPRLALTVKANIEPAVFLRPGFARFIQPKDSKPGEVEQIVFTTTKDDLKILDVESPYPFLDAEVRPAKEEEKVAEGKGNQYVVTLTLDYQAAPIGPLADFVKLTTNHPKQEVVTIPVSGFIRPIVVLTPSTADFGEIQFDGTTDAGLLVKTYASSAMKVTLDPATSLPQGVAVEVDDIEPGRQYRVHVTLDDSLPKGPFAGVIRLKTDNPTEPSIEIPLTGTRV